MTRDFRDDDLVNTVRLWRVDGSGRGPRFFKVGGRAVRYRVGDIRKWMTTQRREPRKTVTSN